MTSTSRRAFVLGALATPLATRAFAQEATLLKIGAPLPLSGALAPEGLKQRRGYDIWADAVNKTGGINVGGKRIKVDMVYVDYESNTPRAVQATERMITQDKVAAIFG